MTGDATSTSTYLFFEGGILIAHPFFEKATLLYSWRESLLACQGCKKEGQGPEVGGKTLDHEKNLGQGRITSGDLCLADLLIEHWRTHLS